MDDVCRRAVETFAKTGYQACPAVPIVGVEGSEQEIADQTERIKAIADPLTPVEFRTSHTGDETLAIWKGRKSAFWATRRRGDEATGRLGDCLCLEKTVPVSKLPYRLRRIGELSREYGLGVANGFHAGDGNMHPLILFNANELGQLEKTEAFGADILPTCVEVGGCLDGEYGVGIETRDLMSSQYEFEDLAIQMEIRDAPDPEWLLNPAKVFPLEASAPHRVRAAAL